MDAAFSNLVTLNVLLSKLAQRNMYALQTGTFNMEKEEKVAMTKTVADIVDRLRDLNREILSHERK